MSWAAFSNLCDLYPPIRTNLCFSLPTSCSHYRCWFFFQRPVLTVYLWNSPFHELFSLLLWFFSPAKTCSLCFLVIGSISVHTALVYSIHCMWFSPSISCSLFINISIGCNHRHLTI
jgi:hypothetical protein